MSVYFKKFEKKNLLFSGTWKEMLSRSFSEWQGLPTWDLRLFNGCCVYTWGSRDCADTKRGWRGHRVERTEVLLSRALSLRWRERLTKEWAAGAKGPWSCSPNSTRAASQWPACWEGRFIYSLVWSRLAACVPQLWSRHRTMRISQ